MKARGFTLIEVMVAMFVIALGVGALLTTLSSAASATGYMREKSFAQWIAFNRLAEVRLSGTRPRPGVTSDVVEYAGRRWRWQQTVSEAGIGDLLRVDIGVAPLDDEEKPLSPSDPDRDEEAPSLGRVMGFIGPALARPSGLTPDWSPRAPVDQGGPGGPGGPGSPGGPGAPGAPGGPGGPGGPPAGED
ncbi:MAG: type II secretion system minor pseudopilin GspI [Pseudomonadota bacterium]|nr:type II secretion system minor pseudopilin GspI [Pseudomonadota bacterium]